MESILPAAKRRPRPQTIKLTFTSYVAEDPPEGSPTISCAGHVVSWLREHGLDRMDKECFVTVTVDQKNRPIRAYLTSVGSMTASMVHPREVFRPALFDGATGVMCVHNHPSGDPTPSVNDREITARLVKCAELLGIRFLDHIITGRQGYVAFSEKGWP